MIDSPNILPPAPNSPDDATAQSVAETSTDAATPPKPPRLDPTRYGDWELNGKCVDF